MTTRTTSTIPAFVPAADADAGIVLADVPTPEPAADEVLIAVEAYSVNRGEVHLLAAPRPGWRPGQDVVGRVLQAAADGGGPREGERVVGHAMQGGWAPVVPVPASAATVLPDSVPSTVASTLVVGGLTVLRLLRRAGALAGTRVLVTGASGGVGHGLAELAIGSGAEVVAVARTPERGELLRGFGASTVERVEDAAGPFDVVFESVGGETLVAAVAAVRRGGRVLLFGQAGGEPARLGFGQLFNEAIVEGFVYWGADGGDIAGDLALLVRLVETGRLHPPIGVVEDWRRTPEVLVDLRDRRVRGNAVLTIGG
ncbi:MAG: zinc-binding dehydrogenase [Thermoleophilia bacterium]